MSYSILRRRTCSSKADNSSSMVTLRLLRSGEGRLCGLYHRENLLTGYHGNGRNVLSFLSIHRFYGGKASPCSKFVWPPIQHRQDKQLWHSRQAKIAKPE